MTGFHDSERKKLPFVHIFNGKFSIRGRPNEDGYQPRINKNKEEVWEKYYNEFTGLVRGVDTRHNPPYPPSLNLSFDDCIISLSLNSGHARNLLQRLPNVDPTLPLTISLYDFVDEETGKNIRGLNLFQDGKKVALAFTKETLPPWKPVTVNGVTHWDRAEQDAVLLDAMRAWKEEAFGEQEPADKFTPPPEDDEPPF